MTFACAADAPASSTVPFTTAASASADAAASDDGTDDDGDKTDDASSPASTSESSEDDADSEEASTSIADTTGDEACPATVDPDAPWMPALQQEVVASLCGAAPLPSGETLAERSSPSNRSRAVAYLEALWIDQGLEPSLHTYSSSGTNLFAAIPATVPTDETVVVGAHFDTVPGSPGANDNATGVAMVTSLGRWLVELPCRSRNVIVVVFDEEEIGLLGSDAFAAFLVGEGVTVHSVHTIDQMGWDDDGDRAIELERADPGLFELYAAAEPLVPGATPLQPTNTGSTDHVSFRAWGFAAVGITEEYVSGDTTPHYHQPSDAFATVDLDYLGSSTRLLHATIGGLVGAPAG